MKKTKLLTLVITMLMMAMSPTKMWAISGSGTSDDPYLIASATDWTNSTFQDALKNSTKSNYVHIKLTGDFSVTSVTLPDNAPYIFLEGQGHTIILNAISTTKQNTGLFGQIGGGYVNNLRIAGNISSTQKYMGNLCGRVKGSLVISKVLCSASIASYVEGDATTGGFVGQIDDGTVTFNECGFTYKFYGKGKATRMCGMVGYRSGGSVVFNNCYCKAAWDNVVSGDNYAYMRNDGSNTTYNNCYYETYGTGGKATAKSSGGPTEIANSAFGSGELAYKLNGSVNDGTRWYQNIDKDAADGYPWPYRKSYDTNNGALILHNTVKYGYAHGETSKTYSNINSYGSTHMYYTCTPTWSNTSNPTSCKVEVTYTCSTCGNKYETLTPACVTTDATCTNQGIYTYTATSTKYKKDPNNYYSTTTTGYFAALGHSFDNTNDPNHTVCTRSGCNHTWIYYTGTAKAKCDGLSSLSGYSDNNHSFSSGKGTIEFPSKLTSIADGAFNSCSGLTSVIIPNSVTSIGAAAFSNCAALSSITIPNSVTSIGENAFMGCTTLASMTIPNSVTNIAKSIFYGCTSLKSVTIPNSVKSIGENAFYQCSALSSITIPNSVTTIRNSTFYLCSNLTSITIPNSVTSIEEYAFKGCSNLTSITIPKSVNSIGRLAFDDCNKLSVVQIEKTSVLEFNSFTNQGNMTLKVPSTLVSNYKATDGWKKFGLIRCISHTPSQVSAVAATCTKAGNIAHYHCNYCGNYSEKAGTTYIADVTTAATGHGQTNGYAPTYTWSTDINTHTCSFTLKCKDCNTNVVSNSTLTGSQTAHTDPTCTATGSTTYKVTGSYDATGSKAYSGNDTNIYTINATGHSWSETSVWAWGEDGKSASCTRTCINDATHKSAQSLTLGKGITSAVKVAATCLDKGTTTYSATATVEGKEYTDTKDVVDIPAAGHTWSETSAWAWADDGHSASCTRTCQRDASHTSAQSVTLGNGITSSTEIAATCIRKGTTTYSATATVEGKEYTDIKYVVDIDATGHSWSETATWIWAEDGYSALCTRTCQNDATHTSAQTAILDKGITSAVSVEPTCLDKGTTKYSATATVEGKEYTDTKDIVDIPAKGHSWSEKAAWSWGDDGHSATCTLTCERDASHTSVQPQLTFGNGITSSTKVEPKCLEKGTTTYSATTTVEGRRFTDTKDIVDIPAIGHSWSETANWEWNDDGKNASCTITCENDRSHQQTFDNSTATKVSITHSETKAATCAAMGENTYKASVTYEGTTYNATDKVIADIARPKHTFDKVSDPDETNCTVCSHTIIHYTADEEIIIIMPDYDYHTFEAEAKKGKIEYNTLLTSIPERYFLSCTGLKSISIPNSVTSIGDQAFYTCTDLKSISIPNSVTSIGDQAFYNCTDLESVSIPNSVTSIGEFAFTNCGEIKELSLGNSIESIGKAAFAVCTGLTNLSIPNSVRNIGEGAFVMCSNLTNVELMSIPEVGSEAFANVPAPIKLALTDNSYVYTSSNTDFPTLSSVPTYSRTMNAEWGTLVLPFDVPASVENQYTLYKVVTHDTENGCISLCQASGTVAAGTPVIVQRLTTDTQLTFTASNENIDATGNLETNELVGTYAKTDLTYENGYIIYGDEFWSIATLANAGKTVKTAPFRAYITDDNATADAKLLINIDNSATDIYNAASGTYASADGDNVKIYNLQGQRINTPVKGINIINGKKVFIKNLQLGEAK